MDAYFSIISSQPLKKGTLDDLVDYFSNENADSIMKPWSENLLEKDYDRKAASRFFYPQLIIFFVRFFDVYDGATKGEFVSEVLKNVERQQKEEHIESVKKSPDTLKNMWDKSTSNSPMGPAETLGSYDKFSEGSNPAIEEQIENLSEAYSSARLDFQALYNYKGTEFIEKWKSLKDEIKKDWVKEIRENITSRAEMGIIYCPEINPDDMTKDNGNALLNLMEDCHKFTDDISQLDSFTSKISLQMKAKGITSKRSLITIIYSRRWVLCTFGVNMIMEVLALGQENAEPVADISDLATKSLDHLQEENKMDLRTRDRSNPLERSSQKEEIKMEANTKPSSPSIQNKKCSNSDCSNQETSGKKFMVCGNCKREGIIVPYCSRDCQQKDWTSYHKKRCVGAKKEQEKKTIRNKGRTKTIKGRTKTIRIKRRITNSIR